MTNDVQEAYTKRREALVVARPVIENAINNFLANVIEAKQIEPGQFTGVEFPAGTTAKEIVPSLWLEPFGYEEFEKYKTELSEFEKFREKIIPIANRLNEEALRCFSE